MGTRYRFSPEPLQRCAAEGVGKPINQAIDNVYQVLQRTYPTQIRKPPSRWMFNNAGGAMGQMRLLYASLHEYLLIFGTPIGTEGHSGRYRSEVWDFMLAGEMWCYEEGQVERQVYRPGDTAYLGAGSAKGYRVPDSAWMLEYGRGRIPAMLPFGLADTLTSTLDLATASRTLWHYGRLVLSST